MLAAAEARQSHRDTGGLEERFRAPVGGREPGGRSPGGKQGGDQDTRTERGAAQRGSRERRGVGVEIGKGLGKRLAGK